MSISSLTINPLRTHNYLYSAWSMVCRTKPPIRTNPLYLPDSLTPSVPATLIPATSRKANPEISPAARISVRDGVNSSRRRGVTMRAILPYACIFPVLYRRRPPRAGSSASRRMGAQSRLVDIGAPARPGRQHQLAVLDDRRDGDEVVLPRHVVDVDLHDAEIRHRGAEMCAHQGREMAVEIMRRDIDLVSVGHRRDLDRLGETVPRHVDDGDVDRAGLEERAKAAAAEQ